jgi:biopolymer transport protein ExbD
MFQKTLNGAGGETNEVNLTPLIDISLCLVVILLLATPLAFETTLGLNRASTTGKQAATEGDHARVELRILSDDVVAVNRSEVPRTELAQVLTPLLGGEALVPVVVSCADEVAHGTFVSVLDVAKQSGAGAVAVTE